MPRVAGKVGIVTGGGSGHLPVFIGYVGTGSSTRAPSATSFSSPTAEDMAIAIGQRTAGRASCTCTATTAAT